MLHQYKNWLLNFNNMEKLKIFASIVEEEAMKQIYRMVSSVAYKDSIIRVMPDVHAGKGCTIGTVINIKDKVVPNTVGVDIGCGVLVMNLGNVNIDCAKLDNIINTHIPSRFNTHTSPVKTQFDVNTLKCVKHIDTSIVYNSIGTLGGVITLLK